MDVLFGILGLAMFGTFLVAALKGRVALGVFGFIIFFIATRSPIFALIGLIPLGMAIFACFSLASPKSVWARVFYDDETMELAREKQAAKEETAEGNPPANPEEN